MTKFNKMMFMNFLILGILITVSAYSWFSMWMGLEINLLSFIPLIMLKTQSSTESAMKYFIIQALASMFLLFSITSIISMNEIMKLNNMYMILNCALLTKMGAAPFHFWFPEVMTGLSWFHSMLLLTIQKISPMVLVTYNNKLNFMFILSIILSSTIGSIMGWNQTNMRKMLAYSSINHIGWMLVLILQNQPMWINYFLIYSFILVNLTSILNWTNSSHFQQTMMTLNHSKNMKTLFFLSLFSLGGLPPFIGFIPKWITINEMTNKSMIPISIILISMALITLFYYLRLTFNALSMSPIISSINLKPTPIKFNFLISLNIFSFMIYPLVFNFL